MKLFGMMLMTTLLAMAPGYGSAEPPGKDITSQATQPKVTEEQAAPVPAAKNYTLKERQVYQKKVAADLDKLQQKIDDLATEGGTASPQMKHTRARAMIGLQKQVFVGRSQLAALEKATEKEWSGLKVEMDKTMKALAKAYKKAESGFQ